MKRAGIAIYMAAVALVSVACMAVLNVALQPTPFPQKQVLIIGDGRNASWPQVEAGARAAARQFGLNVEFTSSGDGYLRENQLAIAHSPELCRYDGAALVVEDPDSQCEAVNQLAEEIRLVTIGKDSCDSRRLCHVGFCREGSGRMVAHLVRCELRPGRQVTLVHSGLQSNDCSSRLEGFREAWGEFSPTDGGNSSLVDIEIDGGRPDAALAELAKQLQNDNIETVIAFDSAAADLVVDAVSQRTDIWPPSVIAFDPTAKVLDAIEAGRMSFALYDDPYRQGFEAVERLSMYCAKDTAALPMPGRGSVPLLGEIIRSENLKTFRQRIGHTAELPKIAQHRVSSGDSEVTFNVPILTALGETFHLPFVSSAFE